MHSTHKPELGDKVLVPGCRYCMVCMALLDSDTNGPTPKAAQPCPGPTTLRPAEETLAFIDQAQEQYRQGMHDSRLARWMMAQIQADERNHAQSPAALHALSRVVALYALAYGDPDRTTHQLNAALFEVQRRWMVTLAEQYRHRIGYETGQGWS